MNCCPTAEATTDSQTSKDAVETANHGCEKCKSQSQPVSRKTVLLMLKPHLLEQALTGKYRFCATNECPTVYFEEHGNRVFTTNDLRIVVGVKAKADPIPVCYCFGFDEHHLRDEIAERGNTTIPERISNLIREGLCACDSRNPSGNCCLGEVNRTVKRLNTQDSA